MCVAAVSIVIYVYILKLGNKRRGRENCFYFSNNERGVGNGGLLCPPSSFTPSWRVWERGNKEIKKKTRQGGYLFIKIRKRASIKTSTIK